MSRRTWIIILIVVAAAAAVTVTVLVTSGGGVTVPDVTGTSQAEATAVLEGAGFTVGDVTQVADQGAAGVVVAQQPAAGSEADEGSAVALTVSSGPSTAEVPDVTGMTKSAAEADLTSAGFVPQSTYQYDARAPEGQVMGQLPAAGTQAHPGSEVGLLVSKGLPDKVEVPAVTGLSEEDAITDLAEAGLHAVPSEAYDDQMPEGSVAGQDPAAGESVAPLSDVLIVVSLGQGTPAVAVPDVVGMTESAAADELEAAGLAVTVAETYSGDVKKGVVIGQEPAAGVKVDEGATVGTLVSLGAAPSPSPTPTPTPSESPTESPTPTPTPTPTETPTKAASPSPEPTPTLPPLDIALPPDFAVDLVDVPDLTGLTLDEASAQLTQLGLRPIPLEMISGTVPEGEVFAQLPPAGRQLPQTFPVLMAVSMGPAAQVNPLPAEGDTSSPGASSSPAGESAE